MNSQPLEKASPFGFVGFIQKPGSDRSEASPSQQFGFVDELDSPQRKQMELAEKNFGFLLGNYSPKENHGFDLYDQEHVECEERLKRSNGRTTRHIANVLNLKP